MKGSCFDDDIKKQVSAFNPNVGFLNPPYKTNKDDIEELEFVLNNLEQLEKGCYCVAIVPMSCALTNNRKNSTLKENLLRKHTLEALFSMPNDYSTIQTLVLPLVFLFLDLKKSTRLAIKHILEFGTMTNL